MKKVTKPIEQKPIPLASLKEELDGDIDILVDNIDEALNFDLEDTDLTVENVVKSAKTAIDTAIKDFIGRVATSVRYASIDFESVVKDKDLLSDMITALGDADLKKENIEQLKDILVWSFNNSSNIGDVRVIQIPSLAHEIKIDAFLNELFPMYSDHNSNVLF